MMKNNYTRSDSWRLFYLFVLFGILGFALVSRNSQPQNNEYVASGEFSTSNVLMSGTISGNTFKQMSVEYALVDGVPIVMFGMFCFDDSNVLERAGDGLYLDRNGAAVPATEVELVQGAIEESNVVPVLEITRMMDVMRSFQAAARIQDTEHERLRRAIQVLTQVS